MIKPMINPTWPLCNAFALRSLVNSCNNYQVNHNQKPCVALCKPLHQSKETNYIATKHLQNNSSKFAAFIFRFFSGVISLFCFLQPCWPNTMVPAPPFLNSLSNYRSVQNPNKIHNIAVAKCFVLAFCQIDQNCKELDLHHKTPSQVGPRQL